MDIFDKAQELEERHRQAAIKNAKKIGGVSLTHCKDCGVEIPEARRNAYDGVEYCIECQVHNE